MKTLIFTLITFCSISIYAQNLKNPTPSEDIKELVNFFNEKENSLNEDQIKQINSYLENYNIKINAILADESLLAEQKKELFYSRRSELKTAIENNLSFKQKELFKYYPFQ